MEYRFACPGCDATRKTVIPKHRAPYHWRCKECDWSMTIQSDEYGISIGWNKPLPKKPKLELVK